MDSIIFNRKLDRLRQGELALKPQGDNDIGKEARKSMPELLAYTAALEAGYRELTGRLGAYRGVANERALGRIVKNQWSSPAALGYAAAALRQSGMNPSQVVGVLELMEELMDEHPRAWAEGVYQDMVEDPGGDGGTDCRGLRPRNDGEGGDGGTDCRGLRPRNDGEGGDGRQKKEDPAC